jgi:glycosyltransferase involved in cell wall biosynthesis
VFGAPGNHPALTARGVRDAVLAARPTEVLLQYTPQMWNTWRFGSTALPRLVGVFRRAGMPVTLIAHELFVPFDRRPDLAVAAVTQRAQLALLLSQVARSFVTTESRIRAMAPISRALGRPAPRVLRVGPSAVPVPALAAGGARIGVFSTAATGKRFDVALDAFERIAAEVPSAELVVIGDLGPPDAPVVRKLTDALRRHPRADRIRLTGKLSLDDVAREIAQLDVYLFPVDTGANTRSSALPTALGSGVPVVAFDGAETDHSVFEDGRNVMLVPRLDGAAFADGALRLLRDPALARGVREGARALYDRHLTWERIVDQLLADA